MINLLILLNIIFLIPINSFRIVGWFNGKEDDIKNIPWDYYTHIVTGTPILYDNGTVDCDLNDNITQTIIKSAHQKNKIVQWIDKFTYDENVIFNETYNYKVVNYLNSLPQAMKHCNIDGIEYDMEWGYKLLDKLGIILPYYSNLYTQFLIKVKNAVNNLLVSIDVGTPGCCCNGCGYPLEFLPWVNVTEFNNGAFDFINIMSYHTSEIGSIDRWKMDRYYYETKWKFNLSKINMAVQYFSMNVTGLKINSEIVWSKLSKSCPNIDPEINICNDLLFVGKNMNYELGKYAKQYFGGAFPWTINYDSFENNNTLINWFIRGVNSI